MPVDFLLSIMRNSEMPLRDRTVAAIAAAPYVHAKLTQMRIIPDPGTMDDV
jgi:hypothetical protein